VLSRTRTQVYWPVIGWAVLILLVCFQNWWSMFGMRNRHDWSFEQFAMILLQTMLFTWSRGWSSQISSVKRMSI
jgi:amino acid permease